MHGRTFRLDRVRITQFQRPKDQVHIMAGHVPQDAVSEIPPVTPRLWQIIGMIGPGRRGSQPEVPMKVSRNRRRLRWPFTVSQAFLTPNVAFSNLSDCA